MCIIYTACNEKTTTIALFLFLHYTLEIHEVCAPGTKKLTALLKLKTLPWVEEAFFFQLIRHFTIKLSRLKFPSLRI